MLVSIATAAIYHLYILISVFLFDDSCSSRCEVVSHCSFDLHFSLTGSGVEHLFTYLLTIGMSSLEKYQFRASAHFLTWLVEGFLFVCYWVSNPVFWVLASYTDIVYHSAGCLSFC